MPKSKKSSLDAPKTETKSDKTYKETIQSLDDQQLRRLLGQLFIVGFQGIGPEVENNKIVEKLILKFRVGGLIFYKRNILQIGPKYSSDDAIKNLIRFINDIKEKHRKIDVLPNHPLKTLPLFLGVDFEGGNTAQLVNAGIATPVPSPMALATLRNKNIVFRASELISAELTELGFNMNFAPVVDVTTNETNNVIQERSFGEDPDFVRELSIEFIKGQIVNNIIPVIKHFPGHGMTNAGFETPDLPISKQRFEAFKSGLQPFFSLVRSQQVPAIMTSHMELTCSGTKENIAFNHQIINKLLQTKETVKFRKCNFLKGLNHKGLVLADNLLEPCVTAKSGVKQPNIDNYLQRVKENVLASFDAGHDMLMLSHLFDDQRLKKDGIKYRKIKDDMYRWSISINEFGQIYNYLDENIFETKDQQLKIERISKLKKALVKIAVLKQRLTRYQDLRSLDIFYRTRMKKEHKKLSDKLYNKSFIILKSQDEYIPLSSLGKKDTLTIFMPSRFISYKGINEIKKTPEYKERLINNVRSFDFTRALYKHFRYKTNLVFELEKMNPTNLLEHKERAKFIVDLLVQNKSDHVIFLINKRARWYLLQQVLEEMASSSKFHLKQVTAIITNDATMLRSHPEDKNIIQTNKLLEKINIIIAFSGYGYRAELLASQLSSGEIGKREATLPFKIEILNPLPSYQLYDHSF